MQTQVNRKSRNISGTSRKAMMPAANPEIRAKPRRFSWQYWGRLAIFTMILSSGAALFLLVYFIHLQVNAFVTPHRNTNIGSPAHINPAYEDIRLTTRDGLQISGWYLPGTRPSGLVLVHGVDANRAGVLLHATILARAGYHLALIDLRGHGYSQEAPNTYGYREALDVSAAVDYLLARPNVDRVGALGTSFGGAVVARAAAIDPRLSVIVIESSYSSLPDAVEDAFDDRSMFPRWPFAPLLITLAERRVGVTISQIDSARDLAAIHPRPILIIHGAADQLFPVRHAYKMYQAAQEPKELWIIEGLGHANPIPGREVEYETRVVGFLNRVLP